jgi:hypothetical protein
VIKTQPNAAIERSFKHLEPVLHPAVEDPVCWSAQSARSAQSACKGFPYLAGAVLVKQVHEIRTLAEHQLPADHKRPPREERVNRFTRGVLEGVRG